jgi:hypothetical protein
MTAAIIKTINLSCLTSRSDYPWDTVNLEIWIAIEQYLIIIVACIPTLTPLVNIVVSGRWRDCCSRSSNANVHFAGGSPGTDIGTSVGTKRFFSPYTSAQAEEAIYPLSWARSETGSRGTGTGTGSERLSGASGSDRVNGTGSWTDGTASEDLVAVARDGRGILMTTEICVRSEYGEPGPPEDQSRLI